MSKGIVFLEGGHCYLGKDQGAVANGYKEAELNQELRELIKNHLINITEGVPIVTDDDGMVLTDVVKSANKLLNDNSISLSIHFNAGSSAATGTEVIYPTRHSIQEFKWSVELSKLVASKLGLKDRGARDEKLTARGKIYIRSMNGHNLLLEVCFITNKSDMDRYQERKNLIAKSIAEFLKEKYHEINQ
jgi:N-acetylmuramoyl-L-alanine amidase